MRETIVKILGVSKNSYWNYKNQNRPIIALLEKYFTKEDLQEFLETGNISKCDIQIPIHKEIINRLERLEQKIKELEKKE